MKTKELRDLTIAELRERVATESAAYDRMKMNHSVSPLDRPHTLTEKRKEVARLKTILREKELDEAVNNL